MWEGFMNVGMFPPPGGGGGTERYSSMRSAVTCLNVIRVGGEAWSTADLYHPLILLHA